MTGQGSGSPAEQTLDSRDRRAETGPATSTDAPAIPIGPRIVSADEITLEKEIGRSPETITWEGRQRPLDRPVAVKTLRPDARHEARFTAEALILCRLQHPAIVPVHAYGRDETGRPVLCTKVTRGVAWSSLLAPVSRESALRAAGADLRVHLDVLGRVCDAIAFAHANGVIHRGLHAKNVLICDYGEVLVTGWDGAVDTTRPGDVPITATRWSDLAALGELLEQVVSSAMTRGIAPPASLLEIAKTARAGGYGGAREISGAIDEAMRNEGSMRLASAALARLDERIRRLEARVPAPAVETYATLAECVGELERAVKSWPGNAAAAAGIVRGTLAFATFAVEQGDALVAAHQLDRLPPGTPGIADLRARIAALEAERAEDRLRRRRWKWAKAAALLVAAAAAVWGLVEMRRTAKAEAARDRRRAAIAATEGATWKEPEARIAIFGEAIAIDPTWREAYIDLCNAYVRQSLLVAETDPAGAEALLRKAKAAADGSLRVDASYAPGAYNAGYCLLMLGDEGPALEELRRAARLGPETHDGVAAATTIALVEKRFEEAARLATVAMERGADEDDYWRRAVARFVLGDLDGAIADLAEAEVILPAQQDYDALTVLCHLAKGDLAAAGMRAVASVKAHPRLPYLGPVLALLAAWRGDAEEARLLALHARDERAAYARCFLDPLNRVLAAAPEPRRALGAAFTLGQDLAAIVPAEPPHATRRRRKAEELLAKGGDPVGALALIERALGDDVADGLSHLAATRALLQLGHREAARRHALLAERLAPHRAAEARALMAEADRR